MALPHDIIVNCEICPDINNGDFNIRMYAVNYNPCCAAYQTVELEIYVICLLYI